MPSDAAPAVQVTAEGRSAQGSAPFPALGGGGQLPSSTSAVKSMFYRIFALLNRHVPKDPTSVVLHSSVDIEDGVLAVIAECRARAVRPTVLLEDPGNASRLRALAGPVRTAPLRSLRGRLYFLRARYAMTTGRLYGSRTPPASQVVVSLWHGEPPTKMTGRFEGRGGLSCTYAPVCSTVGRAYRAAEFDLSPLQVPIVGAPRNDRMLSSDVSAVRAALLGDDAHRTTLLWMPSYRVGNFAGQRRVDVSGRAAEPPFSADDLRRIDDLLVERGARVVVKIHPRDVHSFHGEFRALRVLEPGDLEQQGLTLYGVLGAFDALITDMSSIWVDYLLLDKPMVFAFPDAEHYRHGRGLNLEPYEDWVPGPFAEDLPTLLRALGEVIDGRDTMAQERQLARRRFHQFHDDRSTVRLLDGLGLGLPVR